MDQKEDYKSMQDYQYIKEFFLDLKQSSFYLSYQEELYLEYLLKKNIQKEIILKGIEKYMYRLPIFKRRKAFLFMCDEDINSSITEFIKKMWIDSDAYWYISRFDLIVKRLKQAGLDKKYNINLSKINYPTTEEEAMSSVEKIKNIIFENIYDTLPQETKDLIHQKYEHFKNHKELYEKMVVDHVLYAFGLEWIDLFRIVG
jgi:hypothetical protein